MGAAIATMLGVLIGGHGFIGLFIEGSHLIGVFNVDFVIDLLHLGVAGILLVVGLFDVPAKVLRGALALSGLVYVGVGVLTLGDEYIGGLAPTGMMPLDLLLLFGLGAVMLLTSVLPSATRPLWVTDEGAIPTSNRS